jgi:hypothetical protein
MGIKALRREMRKLESLLAPTDFGEPPKRGRAAWDAWWRRFHAARDALAAGLRDGRFHLDRDGRVDAAGVPPDPLGYARREEARYRPCEHAGTHCTDGGPWLEHTCRIAERCLAGELSGEELKAQAPHCRESSWVSIQLHCRQKDAEEAAAKAHQTAREPAQGPEPAFAPPAAPEAPPRPSRASELPPPESDDGPLDDPMTPLRRAWRLAPTRVHVEEVPDGRGVGICGCGTAMVPRGDSSCFCPGCNLLLPACPCCGVATKSRGNGFRFCPGCNLLWPG